MSCIYKQNFGNRLKGVLVCILSLYSGWLVLAFIKSNDWKTNINTSGADTELAYKISSEDQYSKNVTVVTAYFDIGSFQKGSLGKIVTSSNYYKWAETFHYLKNPLVVYTDSEKFRQHMQTVRKELKEITKIFVIDRTSSWAFKNIDRIRDIYSSEGYPKHYPNTVIPEYSCAQHAKFDVIHRAAEQHFFDTRYYMWLDIGYFRDRIKSTRAFHLSKPLKFDDSKIAMNRLHRHHTLSAEPKNIFLKNLVYVGGGLLFGERRQMITFSSQIEKSVAYFLQQGLMNTDQQVIYAMYSDIGRKMIKPEVDLQCYHSSSYSDWFYLGKSMVRD